MRILTLMTAILLAMPMGAQQEKTVVGTNHQFQVVKQLPITSVKNQYRSGTCWAYGTLGYFESEILVKNTWGDYGPYKGTWYMSRDFMTLNTTYLFLNRHALPKALRKVLKK